MVHVPVEAEVDAMVAKWRSWVEGPIRGDVVGMSFRRMIWSEINGMLEVNPEVGQAPSAFWDFYGENYGAAQGIAIRRQADANRRACSLGLLIKEMRENAERLTRDDYTGLLGERLGDHLMVERMRSGFDQLAGPRQHLDRQIPDRDLEALQRAARQVRVYVDEHLAHDMAEPRVAQPLTFADVHTAIDSISELFKKYAVTLTGAWWAELEPVIQGDWKAILRVPWRHRRRLCRSLLLLAEHQSRTPGGDCRFRAGACNERAVRPRPARQRFSSGSDRRSSYRGSRADPTAASHDEPTRPIAVPERQERSEDNPSACRTDGTHWTGSMLPRHGLCDLSSSDIVPI